MSDTATVLKPGELVGETYEIVRLIGRGGMGEVWMASHRRLPGKQVAIKVLHTRVGGLSAEALARFRREAEVASRIGHPNIVEVHDYNTLANGNPYLVLEFLQGESLANRLRFGPMTVDDVVMVLRQVGSALDASHQIGVVHRDLKPDNIFLVPTPMGTQVKVLDFGISKVVDSNTLQTADEVLVGTPQYMSPEQATGQNKDVGPQTDVFALGSIAYEMLTGSPPFMADSVAKIVFRIAYEPHTPLEQVKPGLPARIYTAVERALQKEKDKRWASVADFIGELSGQPVPRTLPPPSVGPGESSGVHRPGMATPDSMAWGVTAARTPMPPSVKSATPSSAAAPAPEQQQQLAPPRRSMFGLVVLGLAVVAAGLAVYLVFFQPPPTPVVVVPDWPKVPDLPVAAVVVDAGGSAAVEPAVDAGAAAVEHDAGAPAVVVKAEKPEKPKAKIPDAELAVLAEMENLLKEKNPYDRLRIKLNLINSPAGLSRAYGLTTKSACIEKDLGRARAQYNRVEETAERQKVAAFCRKLDIELE